jgi:hypothetical protein
LRNGDQIQQRRAAGKSGTTGSGRIADDFGKGYYLTEEKPKENQGYNGTTTRTTRPTFWIIAGILLAFASMAAGGYWIWARMKGEESPDEKDEKMAKKRGLMNSESSSNWIWARMKGEESPDEKGEKVAKKIGLMNSETSSTQNEAKTSAFRKKWFRVTK